MQGRPSAVVRVDCWSLQADATDLAVVEQMVADGILRERARSGLPIVRLLLARLAATVVPSKWSVGPIEGGVAIPPARWRNAVERIGREMLRTGGPLVLVLDEIDRCEPLAAQRFLTLAPRMLAHPGVVVVISYVENVLRHKVFDPAVVELPELRSTMIALIEGEIGSSGGTRAAREQAAVDRLASLGPSSAGRLHEMFEEKFFSHAPVVLRRLSGADVRRLADRIVPGDSFGGERRERVVEGAGTYWQELHASDPNGLERDREADSIRRLTGRMSELLQRTPRSEDGIAFAVRLALAASYYRRLPAWPAPMDPERLRSATTPESAILVSWWFEHVGRWPDAAEFDVLQEMADLRPIRGAAFEAVPDFERLSNAQRLRRLSRPVHMMAAGGWLRQLARHCELSEADGLVEAVSKQAANGDGLRLELVRVLVGHGVPLWPALRPILLVFDDLRIARSLSAWAENPEDLTDEMDQLEIDRVGVNIGQRPTAVAFVSIKVAASLSALADRVGPDGQVAN